jgi:hypothetical protein
MARTDLPTRARRRRYNFTLAPQTAAILEQTSNASRYLDALVQARDRAWRRALRRLLRKGCPLAEVRLALASAARPAQAADADDRCLRVLIAELEAGNEAVQAALFADAAVAAAREIVR